MFRAQLTLRALLALALSWVVLTPAAHASRPALDPEIRVHAGGSWVPGPKGLGVMAGFDSRLTKRVHVDIGGLISPVAVPLDYELSEDLDPAQYFRLRHSIYIAPGYRIPHRQPINVTWDVLLRAGPAMVWSADLSPDANKLTANSSHFLEFDAAGFVGLDLLLQHKRSGAGVRATGKVFLYNPFYETRFDDIIMWAPQVGLEAVYGF